MKNVLLKIRDFIKDEFIYLNDSYKALKSRKDRAYLRKYTSEYIKSFYKQNKNELDTISSINAEDYKIPLIIDDNFSRYFQKFIHSYRNKEHPTININNLLFLSGPEKNGKSWFLRHNLKKFDDEEGEKKTLTIHYDIKQIDSQNFHSFLFNFEQEIITSIVQRSNYELNKHNQELICINDLKNLLFYRWEKGWIEINLSKSIKRSINGNYESPYTFFINTTKYQDELMDLIDLYENKAYRELIFCEHIDRLIEIISESMEINILHAALLLIQDLLIQREDYRKDSKIHSGELYRDGLEVMEYLFDVLNHIAGYHEKQLSQQELANEEIQGKIYPHVVLALEGVGAFFEMKDAENRPMDYLHRIMFRLFNNTGYRNHFPIVLETNKNFYFDREIYDHMWEMKYTFPSLVYLPTQFWNKIEKTLDKIFNNYQKEYTISIFGSSSIYYYDSFVEAIKANDQTTFFPNTGLFLQNEYNRYLYKINKLYANPKMALHLDKGTIDYEVIDALNQWNKVFIKHLNPYIALRRKQYDNEWLMQPITMAMFDENIIFYNKYFKRVHFEQDVMNYFNRSALESLKKTKLNNIFKKIYFEYYRFRLAFNFHMDYYTIGQKKYKYYYTQEGWDYSSKDWIYGDNLKWDVPNELYKGYKNQSWYEPTGQSSSSVY